MIQPQLFAVVTVHCFFTRSCQHVESGLEPQDAHAAMEEHYAAVHAEDIRCLLL